MNPSRNLGRTYAPGWFRSLVLMGVVRVAVVWGALVGGTGPLLAGGGPENLFLVVNGSSPQSLAVANAFAALRQIPPINVLMLPWTGSTEAVPIGTFRSEILKPLLQAIESRKLSTQIDCVVYSADFPWRVDFADELPAEFKEKDHFPSASLTGLTMLYGAVLSGRPVFLDPASNHYYRPLNADGVPEQTQSFRSWYGWGPQGELLEAGGPRYLLATMLGVTAGRGNTVAEVVRSLQSAAAADGTRPAGTIYFSQTKDVRSTTRSGPFPSIVKELEKLGIKSEIIATPLPARKRDVAGLLTGVSDFNWENSGSKILPGAICENLTSFGGIFTPSAGQTPLSEFLRAGAAGSSGTIIEPYALQPKFPHPAIQVHYARGASLAEAFYQAVHSPYQLLVVGDPLCQPWARIPQVSANTAADNKPMAAGQTVTGSLEIAPTAKVTGTAAVDRFEFFIDGMRTGQCGPGETFLLDTLPLADGHHELRVVALDSSPVETQGRLVLPLVSANHGHALKLSVQPLRVKPTGTVRVSVAGQSLDGVAIYALGRVLGRTSGGEATIEVPADVLGLGPVTIRATGRVGTGAVNSVNALPVTIEVTEQP